MQDLEPWVDSIAVGKHLGWSRQVVQRMAQAEQLPCVTYVSGKKTYFRFKLSEVDLAVKSGQSSTPRNRTFTL